MRSLPSLRWPQRTVESFGGFIANHTFYLGASPPQFKVEIAVVVFFLLSMVLGPLLLFNIELGAAKRTGDCGYGTMLTMMPLEELVRKLIGILL